jgi:hypothetical protein
MQRLMTLLGKNIIAAKLNEVKSGLSDLSEFFLESLRIEKGCFANDDNI